MQGAISSVKGWGWRLRYKLQRSYLSTAILRYKQTREWHRLSRRKALVYTLKRVREDLNEWFAYRWALRRPLARNAAQDVVRSLFEWYKEDERRFVTGQWFATFQPHATGGVVRNELTDKGQSYSGPRTFQGNGIWNKMLAAQQEGFLSVCVNGGFDKFAWERLGKPDMSKLRNRLRVENLSLSAALLAWSGSGGETPSGRPVAETKRSEDVSFSREYGARDNLISSNDNRGYHTIMGRLATALGEEWPS
jgi:hypothetical protein